MTTTMTTEDMALLGRVIESLERLGMDRAARAILVAGDRADILVALYRAVGELGGRPGWESAGRALDAATTSFRVQVSNAESLAASLR